VSALELLSLFAGLFVVTLPVWLPRGAVRVAGALWIFAAAVPALRALLGSGAAVMPWVAGVALGAAAWRALPTVLLRRAAFLVPSLVLLIYVTTLLMYKAPGNPFAQERVASPQVEAALRAQYGVPEDATEFFGIYVRGLIVDGTMGPSIRVQGRNVEDLLLPALPVSMTLGLLALVIAASLGLGFGLAAGLRPHAWPDYASMALAMIGISLPNFVIGAVLILVFALQLGWFPVAGWGSTDHLWLPALTLGLPYSAYIARLVRAGTIDAMQQDYIRTARAKGLPESEVVMRHAFRAAVAPAVSFLGPAAAGIMTGSFVVEVLFGVPGMGQWFVKGAINRDYAVVLGTATIYFTLITLFNLVVDLAQAWLDPRVREAR
jgi:oligopeptide transport system permease protein